MKKFEHFRITAKNKLADIAPRQQPYELDGKKGELEELDRRAKELDALQNVLYASAQRKVLLVLQGMDTSGKDGTIRWVFQRTSPLGIRVHAFKAPTTTERARDFLWRCHAVVPACGELAVWNRSHYEDVLVPVVEGWIGQDETQRRFAHINNFEKLLSDTGTTIIKCMLHISKDEQRKRLQDRLDDPNKNWKFAPEDITVRKQWNSYEQAYDALLNATSTDYAPWYVIPSDIKRQRNLIIADLLNTHLRDMKLQFPDPAPGLAQLTIK